MTAETYTAVILLSLMSLFTTWIGVSLAIRFRESAKGISFGIGFSAGIMLLISFLELIPESINSSSMLSTMTTVTIGGALVWLLHFIIPHVHLIEERGMIDVQMLRTAYLVIFGLVLHDIPEGFAMANSFIASPSLGVLVALAIALHNIPEEFAMAAPIVPLKKPKLLYGAALLSALAEPAGAIIGLIAVDIHPALNTYFISFAAGAMIFVSLHELLPMALRYRNITFFLAGAALSLGVYELLGLITLR